MGAKRFFRREYSTAAKAIRLYGWHWAFVFSGLLWTCYAGFVDKSGHLEGSPKTDRTSLPSFEELAAQQGVAPIDDFEALLGPPWREDESAEEFAASLRGWRREGTLPPNPR